MVFEAPQETFPSFLPKAFETLNDLHLCENLRTLPDKKS